MNIDISRIRTHIQNFTFNDLFIDELGWDYTAKTHIIHTDDNDFDLSIIAEKRDLVVATCNTIPVRNTRLKIEKQFAKLHHENIIIYVDADKTEQVWQWAKKETGTYKARERRYKSGQTGENIAQILTGIAFSMDEEDSLSIVDVTSRVRAAFDIEKVTKKFYDKFKKQHDAFLAFIDGIPDEDLERWYASVMLNRLMFIYFVQKKGLLNNDVNYLGNKLNGFEGNYYHDFLCVLFFDGLAKKASQRSPETNKLLGNIPYLNGGLFLPHTIEEQYGKAIQIPNEAFEKLFGFFDEYRWHLDEQALENDNEINPDVLGYIFEKYINQKQMGAYYTKEDITEYISKNTVIPYLFDEARKAVKIAFEGEHTVWDLLADVSQRGDWNTPAPPEFGLPTEIWRETVARRQRYFDIRGKLENSEVTQINDLITLNLDIQQFAQDVIRYSDSSDLIRAFWKAINGVTVLDPTCGSGAFLFAALNILEPLYDRCLDRMQDFVDDLPDDAHPQKLSDFKTALDRMAQHPNRRYFILKSIIIQNLYGVDIMEEAVEIAKLRLFLKLVAQVDDKNRIEPLPDIDFNIRSGNTLVGFATQKQLKQAITNPTGDAPNYVYASHLFKIGISSE